MAKKKRKLHWGHPDVMGMIHTRCGLVIRPTAPPWKVPEWAYTTDPTKSDCKNCVRERNEK